MKRFWIILTLAFWTIGLSAQPIRIRDEAGGGDCVGRAIGTWTETSKTCTLTASQSSAISIESNGVTLDGAGSMLRFAAGAGAVGVSVSNNSGVTIKNIHVVDFRSGIRITGGDSNTVQGVHVIGVRRTRKGITLVDTSLNTIVGNHVKSTAGDDRRPGHPKTRTSTVRHFSDPRSS